MTWPVSPLLTLSFGGALLLIAVLGCRSTIRCRRAERVLRLLRFAVDRTSDAVFFFDGGGRILDVNDAACESLGYSRAELLDMMAWDFVEASTLEIFHGRWQALRENNPCTVERRHLTRDGRTFPVEVSLTLVEHGRRERVYVCARDISQRKKADEKLRSTNDTLRALLRTSPLAIIAVDAEETTTLWNEAATELFGSSEAEVLGGPVPDTALAVRGLLEACVRRGISRSERRVRLEARDSHERAGTLVCWTVPLRDGPGHIIGGIAMVADVSERDELERELLRIGGRERARLARDLHDGVGQTLTATSFLAKALALDLAADDHPGASDAQEIVDLVSAAIAESRTVASELVMAGVERDGLGPALAELAAKWEQILPVRCRFEGQENAEVWDPSVALHLFQIAQEAVANAVKHAEPQHIWIRLDRNERELILSVENDGGEFQAASTNGGGMGLQIMRYRATRIDGHLDMESRDGGGTVVRCRAPMAESSHVASGG